MKRVLAGALMMLALCGAASAQEAQKQEQEQKQFVHVLKLTPQRPHQVTLEGFEERCGPNVPMPHGTIIFMRLSGYGT